MRSSDELRAAVGELQWLGFETAGVDDALRRRIVEDHIGAVLLFRRNVPMRTAPTGDTEVDLVALRQLCDELHRLGRDSAAGLWLAIDQEGGSVQRVRAPATVWPPMLALQGYAAQHGEAAAEALAEQIGAALGAELAALGLDVDFAPVLDVHSNPANPVIGERAFGTEPRGAARRGLAFARGLAVAGIVGCGKHFPGHGDTVTDSHVDLPRIAHPWSRLAEIELLPFREAALAGVPMLMTAHVVFDALAPGVAATLAPEVMTSLLRNQLGFGGLIVSDDLDMQAIAARQDVGEAAVAAIAAGCDALLLCRSQDNQARVGEALQRRAHDDVRFAARVRESAERIRTAKRAHAAQRAHIGVPELAIVGCHEHQALARRLAEIANSTNMSATAAARSHGASNT